MRALAITILLASATRVHAQPADDDAAIALALFAEGRDLAAHGDYANACAKYEAARTLEPWLGIALNLADCYAHAGQTARAWVMFRKAGDDGERVHDPRAAYARQRADELEPTLAHVTITARAGVTLSLDHGALPAASLDVALPIDPGDHVVDAIAPERVAWSHPIHVDPGSSLTVSVPELPHVATTETVAVTATRPGHRPRWLVGLAASGVAVVGAAIVVGIDAKLRYDDAHGCTPALICDPASYAAIHDARFRGDIATVVGATGVAMLAGAAIAYLRIPVVPIHTPSVTGLGIRGSL